MDVFLRILFGFLSTVLFGGLLGLGLAVASRRLRVEKDKTVEALEAALPGLNCGACGYAGCPSYAEALASGEDEDLTRCTPGGAATLTGIGEVLGQDVDAGGPRMVARVHCIGTRDVAGASYDYDKFTDCQAAWNHFQGPKACKDGCMGLGSCIKVCPVDAIAKTPGGIVSIDPVKCIGCEQCLDVCPPRVIRMIPADADVLVACNSHAKGKDTKTVCSVGCIACRICERKFPDAGYKMEENLSVIRYDVRGEGRLEAAEKCPVHCIIPATRKS